MKGLLNRAPKAAAVVAVILATAVSASALAADVSSISAPQSRFAGTFVLDLNAAMPGLTGGLQDLSRAPYPEISSTLFLTDGLALDTGVNVDIGRMLDRYLPGTGAYDGLFYSASSLNSPYVSLSSGGSYLGLNLRLADGLHLTVGRAFTAPGYNAYRVTPISAQSMLGGMGLPFDARNTASVLAGMTWDFAKWGGIGFTASQTTERGGVLGLNNPGIASARTTAIGVTARVGFGGGWVTTASYSEGSTQLDLRPGALAPDASLRGESFGVAVAKHGLFSKKDALGVSFARPALNFGTAFTNETAANSMQFFGRDKLYVGTAPETDIELGYKTQFFGDSVALQANASYQMNYGGRVGNNAVSLLSRAKIKF
jgi:hypothetical protein